MSDNARTAHPVQAMLQRLDPLARFEHVPVLDSTNTELMRRARAGDTSTCLLWADQQTAGRGRMGRDWQGQSGDALTFSLGMVLSPADWSGLSLAVGCCLADSLDPTHALGLALKWPNDLVIDRAKLGGLLAVGAPRDRFVVVGIGVNVGWSPPDAVSLRDRAVTKDSVTPLALLALMLNEIDTRLVRSDAELHAEHKAALATLGQRVRVELHAGESVVGVAEDLDGAGRLLVRSDDMQLHEIGVGDVVHLRAQ